MNELHDKDEKELLKELIILQKSNRDRQTTTMIMVIVMAAVLLISAAIVVPRSMAALTQINVLMEETGSSLAQMNSVAADAEKLIEDNTENLTEVMEKINHIDFDSLNASIQSLSEILKPLASFFSSF